MKTSFKIAGLAVIATIIASGTVLGLSGCVASAPVKAATHSVASSAPESSAAPSAAANVIPSAVTTTVGGKIDSSTAVALNAAGKDAMGYQLADGSYVFINKTKPLPANVLADIGAGAKPILAAVGVANRSVTQRTADTMAIRAYFTAKYQATGESVFVIIFPGIEADGQLDGSYSTGGTTGIRAAAHSVIVPEIQAWAVKNGAQVIDLG